MPNFIVHYFGRKNKTFWDFTLVLFDNSCLLLPDNTKAKSQKVS